MSYHCFVLARFVTSNYRGCYVAAAAASGPVRIIEVYYVHIGTPVVYIYIYIILLYYIINDIVMGSLVIQRRR